MCELSRFWIKIALSWWAMGRWQVQGLYELLVLDANYTELVGNGRRQVQRRVCTWGICRGVYYKFATCTWE